MSYKVLFFNSQSLYGFVGDFLTEQAAEAAGSFFKDKHYNNSYTVIDDFPEFLQSKVKEKK